MPGFTTDIVDVDLRENKVRIIGYIDWFLENIVIWAHVTFDIELEHKVKVVDGVHRVSKQYTIKQESIPPRMKDILSQSMVFSLRSKTLNKLNEDH